MLKDPLPRSLDVRKAAARGVTVSGSLSLAEMPRFLALLASDSGRVQANVECGRDEENHSVIAVTVEAEVSVVCQRCLEPMTLPMACSNRLAVVWTDEQAKHLPRELDPLISEDDCRLWEMVEDELILALPVFNYHEDPNCNEILNALDEAPADEAEPDSKPNPFEVLAQLKPGKD